MISIVILESVFVVALAGIAVYIGYLHGVEKEKERGDAERKNMLKLMDEQVSAAFTEGKEQGIRESKPKHGANGRFIA